MYDLTAFQRDILYVVAGLESPNGLAVKEQLDQYYGEDINHGRLYPNLSTLVDKGLLEKGVKDRRTNEYELADRGQREIVARRQFEEEHTAGLFEEAQA